jgi:hypothetical protein
MRNGLWLLGSLSGLLGCTLDAGHGFATMEAGELSAELRAGPARDLGDHTLLTDLGYHVQLARARLHVASVELLELQGSTSAGGAFDPAHPPEGYTLCHGGHCHADDGSLVSYEEIQAMLAGGSVRFEPVVAMPVDRALDLLEGASVALTRFEPSPELPQATLARAQVQIERFELEATVSDGELADPVVLSADLALAEPLSQVLNEQIDREGPERLHPAVEVTVDGTLFDGLDFAALVQGGTVAIEEGSPAAALLTEALVTSELQLGL